MPFVARDTLPAFFAACQWHFICFFRACKLSIIGETRHGPLKLGNDRVGAFPDCKGEDFLFFGGTWHASGYARARLLKDKERKNNS